jgi:hypothetical protein
VPSAIRCIHSRYLGDKAFLKDITEFEVRGFLNRSAADHRAIRVDSNMRSRLRSPHPAVQCETDRR